MRADSLPQIQVPLPALIPPEGARPTGEVLDDGRIVYKMRRLNLDKTAKNKKQTVDADGAPAWRRHPTTGEKMYPIMTTEPVYEDVEFVLEASRQQHVAIITNFRGTPEERASDAKRKQKNEFSERLAELATERGISADELVIRLVERVRETSPGQVVVEIPDDREPSFPKHKGGGHWQLSDGTTMRGSRDEAEAAEAHVLLGRDDIAEFVVAEADEE
jgi:hypothetical protein